MLLQAPIQLTVTAPNVIRMDTWLAVGLHGDAVLCVLLGGVVLAFVSAVALTLFGPLGLAVGSAGLAVVGLVGYGLLGTSIGVLGGEVQGSIPGSLGGVGGSGMQRGVDPTQFFSVQTLPPPALLPGLAIRRIVPSAEGLVLAGTLGNVFAQAAPDLVVLRPPWSGWRWSDADPCRPATTRSARVAATTVEVGNDGDLATMLCQAAFVDLEALRAGRLQFVSVRGLRVDYLPNATIPARGRRGIRLSVAEADVPGARAAWNAGPLPMLIQANGGVRLFPLAPLELTAGTESEIDEAVRRSRVEDCQRRGVWASSGIMSGREVLALLQSEVAVRPSRPTEGLASELSLRDVAGLDQAVAVDRGAQWFDALAALERNA